MKNQRFTKIVATIGPATSTKDALRGLLKAGVDVIRINASHEAPENFAALVRRIRGCAEESGQQVSVMLDLPGPKIRTGEFLRPITLKPGDEIAIIAGQGRGDERGFYVDFPPLFKQLRKDDPILLADGSVEMEVVRPGNERILAKVVRGGVLRSHKGVNCPTVKLQGMAFTEHDKRAAAAGVEAGIRVFALSFVGDAADVTVARDFFRGLGIKPFLVSKIERGVALDNLGGIVAASDGVMVARGDLGVETGLEGVGILQKQVIRQALQQGRAVITATQMMESMVEASRPTRAEVADVTNAVIDGTGAVMLSEETAVGAFPVSVVEFMDRICRKVEASKWFRPLFDPNLPVAATRDKLVSMAATAVIEGGVSALVVEDHTMASHLAALHLNVPIFVPVTDPAAAEPLNLMFGVFPVPVDAMPVEHNGIRAFIRDHVPAGSVLVISGATGQGSYGLNFYEN